MPKSIIGSSQWLGGLWSRKEVLRSIPALILWGKRDIAFRDKELATWREAFERVEVHEFDQVGHYVQEEMGADLCPVIDMFLKSILDS
jgi:haloalkane dehalogenase